MDIPLKVYFIIVMIFFLFWVSLFIDGFALTTNIKTSRAIIVNKSLDAEVQISNEGLRNVPYMVKLYLLNDKFFADNIFCTEEIYNLQIGDSVICDYEETKIWERSGNYKIRSVLEK